MECFLCSGGQGPTPGFFVCTSCGTVSVEHGPPCDYGEGYKNFRVGLERSCVGVRLNAIRLGVVASFLPLHSVVVDYGGGIGSFTAAARSFGYDAYNYDIEGNEYENPLSRRCGLEKAASADMVCFFDSLEHFQDPTQALKTVSRVPYILVTYPRAVPHPKESRHYKPGEHFWLFSKSFLGKLFSAFGYEEVYCGEPESVFRDRISTQVFSRAK